MIYRFLEFELDETRFELRFEGQPVAVQARVFALIAYLLRHRDRVVTKEELVRELWKANAVSDTAISQVVMLARKALRDAMRRPLLSIMAEVCALLEDRERAARIYPLLAPWAGLNTILQAGVCLGPVNYYVGRLACTLSQLEAAEAHFEQALLESEGSLPALTRTQYAFGRMLADAANSPSLRGRELLRAAGAQAERLGMTDLYVAAEQALEHASRHSDASGVRAGQ